MFKIKGERAGYLMILTEYKKLEGWGRHTNWILFLKIFFLSLNSEAKHYTYNINNIINE